MSERARPTRFQRMAVKKLRREAGRSEGEPLEPEDWATAWQLHETGLGSAMGWLFRTLPRSPRCGICAAPFEGPGRWVAGPLGYRPSRKNPVICATCVELSPPGGMTMQTGILFADLRGFTARTERAGPEETSKFLRRFYRYAEDVLFPRAVIDKLIGDEVMALYLPTLTKYFDPEDVPVLMVDQALELLRAVGYGSGEEPFAEVGIGLDFGEAFVGNIGQRALYDFTAVGDVVNTAARLQGSAGAGEIVYSDRVAAGLPDRIGTQVDLKLKGKAEPQRAYRVSVNQAAAA